MRRTVLRTLFGRCIPLSKRASITLRASHHPTARMDGTQESLESTEAYSSRWEGMWVGSGSGPLQPGQAFDGGRSSPALADLLASGKLGPLEGKTIFVPGCGRGYDLVTFVRSGADGALGLELSATAVAAATEYVRSALGPELADRARVVGGDFFKTVPERFDMGYDYTFLCALHPDMRPDWAARWALSLKEDGVLVTQIFPVDAERESGPPWPVTPELYKDLLLPNGFVLLSLEPVPQALSHAGRGGKEWLAVWQRSGSGGSGSAQR